MDERCKAIKQDLKDLGGLRAKLSLLCARKEQIEYAMKVLSSIGTPEAIEEVNRLKHEIKRLEIVEISKKIGYIEDKYLKIINKLPYVDYALITKALIDGHPYWKVGREVGYSERGVQDRIGFILAQIKKSI